MSPWMQFAAVFISGVFASSGFWTWLMSRSRTQRAPIRLLLSLAYDKIAVQGMHFIDRGWVTEDEYREYRTDLADPYLACGGNGVAKQIIDQVSQLPLRSHPRYVDTRGRSDGEQQ